MLRMSQKVVCLLFGLIVGIYGHTYHIGNCPEVEPVKNFNVDKFLGSWYVIEKTNSKSKDQIIEFSKGDEEGQLKLEKKSVRTGILGSILGSTKSESAKLTLGDKEKSKMKVKFQLNPASYDFTVFTTDYTDYAGIFSCQEVVGVNRRSISILSRTPALASEEIYLIRRKLSEAGINPDSLSQVYQSDARDANGTFTEPNWALDPRFGQVENKNYTFL